MQHTYEVRSENPYVPEDEKTKTVSVRLLDVLFDNQVCNLVYIQDVTSFFEQSPPAFTLAADAATTYERT